jgi:hypothetical protein
VRRLFPPASLALATLASTDQDGWTFQHLETLLIFLSAVALLMHGTSQVLSFLVDWSKPPASHSHLSRFYPHQYKDTFRWRMRGIGGLITFSLGVALVLLAMRKYRGL